LKRIFVNAKPNSKIEKIEKIDDENFIVFVKEKPFKGKANKRIAKILAEYLKISQKSLKLVSSGQKLKRKVFEINV